MPPYPKSLKQARASPYAREWEQEHDAFIDKCVRLGTWTSVEPNINDKPVQNICVYHYKTDSDGRSQAFLPDAQLAETSCRLASTSTLFELHRNARHTLLEGYCRQKLSFGARQCTLSMFQERIRAHRPEFPGDYEAAQTL